MSHRQIVLCCIIIFLCRLRCTPIDLGNIFHSKNVIRHDELSLIPEKRVLGDWKRHVESVLIRLTILHQAAGQRKGWSTSQPFDLTALADSASQRCSAC
jgi:hypothetical protein